MSRFKRVLLSRVSPTNTCYLVALMLGITCVCMRRFIKCASVAIVKWQSKVSAFSAFMSWQINMVLTKRSEKELGLYFYTSRDSLFAPWHGQIVRDTRMASPSKVVLLGFHFTHDISRKRTIYLEKQWLGGVSLLIQRWWITLSDMPIPPPFLYDGRIIGLLLWPMT